MPTMLSKIYLGNVQTSCLVKEKADVGNHGEEEAKGSEEVEVGGGAQACKADGQEADCRVGNQLQQSSLT